MLFIVQKNALKNTSDYNFKNILIVTEKKTNNKNKSKEKLKTARLKRLEYQLKTNILKRKIAMKKNG